jgi:hypothetical protein
MKDRPDPLAALRAAVAETGVSLPEGLLEQVLQLESDVPEQQAARSMVQASLRTLIETHAKDTT